MIDRLDAKILDLMQHNNRMTVEQLGAEVGLSPSACQRRLARLRADKVIRSDVSIIDPAKIGRRLTMIIEVTLEREDPETVTRFKQAMRRHPQVTQCYYVTGDKDFILIVCMRCMEEFDTFQNEFCTQNPSISRFSTSVVVDPVKVGLAIVIDANGRAV